MSRNRSCGQCYWRECSGDKEYVCFSMVQVRRKITLICMRNYISMKATAHIHCCISICYSVCKFSDFVKDQCSTPDNFRACYGLPLEAQGVHDPAKMPRCQGAKVKRAKVSTILQDTLLGTNWWPTSKALMCALIKFILIQYSQFNPRTPASEQCHFVF